MKKMKNLLFIETSTKNCSVAISSDSKLIGFKEINSENFSHAEILHVFIKHLFKEAKIDIQNLSGVVIGKGTWIIHRTKNRNCVRKGFLLFFGYSFNVN